MCREAANPLVGEAKTEVVMRLLRGESLDELSRETGQPEGMLSQWRDGFLGGEQMLKRRTDDPVIEAMAAEKQRLQAKVGEQSDTPGG